MDEPYCIIVDRGQNESNDIPFDDELREEVSVGEKEKTRFIVEDSEPSTTIDIVDYSNIQGSQRNSRRTDSLQ